MQAPRVDDAARAIARLAAQPDPSVEEMALAIAAAFRDAPVDAAAVARLLDELAAEARPTVAAAAGDPAAEASALAEVLGERHGFAGDREDYDAPRNSFLDVVLERRRGLPILLSVLWLSVAGRTGVELVGVGLPGHFVVAHVGAGPPLVLDPFDGGRPMPVPRPGCCRSRRRTTSRLRMLGNLALAYERRGDPAPGAAGGAAAAPAADRRRAAPAAGAGRAAARRAVQLRAPRSPPRDADLRSPDPDRILYPILGRVAAPPR